MSWFHLRLGRFQKLQVPPGRQESSRSGVSPQRQLTKYGQTQIADVLHRLRRYANLTLLSFQTERSRSGMSPQGFCAAVPVIGGCWRGTRSGLPLVRASRLSGRTKMPHSTGFTSSGKDLRSSSQRLKILTRDAEPAHDRVQGRSFQSETGRGLADHPTALPERSDNMLAFHLLKRGMARDWGCFRQEFG